jgi:DeoR family fructose operon transcriptional repressor
MEAAMIPYERQQRILELLKGRELVWLEELQREIPGVSSSTLRRDIKELERVGKVEHLQGGAIKASTPTGELPLSVKSALYAEEKTTIAKLAAREIQDGDTIYLDSGTTCTALMREIADRDVNVVTSNTDVVALVTPESTAKVTLLGGSYDPAIGSISGPLTQENIDRHVFLKAFLGANGVDARFGITTPSLAEAAKKQAVAARSKYVYVLADSSKFHQVTAIQTLNLADVTVISDQGDEELAALTTLTCE